MNTVLHFAPQELAELRAAVALANKPAPAPLPEQDSRVGEAMAGQQDTRNRALWLEETGKAQRQVLAMITNALNRQEQGA